MSLLLKIPLFIVFLLAFIVWSIVSLYLINKFTKDLLQGKIFWSTELNLLYTIFALFGFVWLLSFTFSIKLFILYILCFHIGFVITGILWRLIGKTDIPWAASLIWTGSELNIKYPLASQVTNIICFLLLVAYPIVIGITYFSNPIPSTKATILIFRYTLIFIYGASFIVLLPSLTSTLSSKNLDEDTRLRILVSQGGGMIINALMIALIFWSFEITGKGYNLQVGGISLTISPVLILVIFVFFVCTILIPYFIGAQQGKNWRINLIEKKKGWFNNLLEVLGFPISSQYIPKLEELQNYLISEEKEFVENDLMIKKGIAIDEVESTEDLNVLEKAYKESREYEPRFCYLDFLRHLKKEVEEIITELSKKKKDADKVEMATAFTQPYRSKKDDLDKTIDSERKFKPIVSTAFVGLVLAIIVPILNGLGDFIWSTFEQTMK